MASLLIKRVGICLLSCLLSSTASALQCVSRSQILPDSLVTSVVEYTDSGTKRQTVDEYAISHGKKKADVAANTAATGRLTCGKFEASANLVIKGDVIVTAGHVLADPKTCLHLNSPSDCKFQVMDQPPVAIESLIKSGFACPTLPGKDDD